MCLWLERKLLWSGKCTHEKHTRLEGELTFYTEKDKDQLRGGKTGTQCFFLLVNHLSGSKHLINCSEPDFLSTQVSLYLWQKSTFDMKYEYELYRDNLSKNTFLFIYLGIKQSLWNLFSIYFYKTTLTWGTNS